MVLSIFVLIVIWDLKCFIYTKISNKRSTPPDYFMKVRTFNTIVCLIPTKVSLYILIQFHLDLILPLRFIFLSLPCPNKLWSCKLHHFFRMWLSSIPQLIFSESNNAAFFKTFQDWWIFLRDIPSWYIQRETDRETDK